MEPASRWVNNSDNLALSTFPGNNRRHHFFSPTSKKLQLARVKSLFVTFNVLFRILNGRSDDVNTDYFLRVCAKTETYRTCATANVEQSCGFINASECADLSDHLLEYLRVYLKEGEWRHVELEPTKDLLIAILATQHFELIIVFVPTAEIA